MRLVVLFVIFYVVAGFAYSSSAVELLQQRLSEATEDQQASILVQLFDALIKNEPSEALNYAQKAEKKALQHNQYNLVGISRKQQGNYYYQKKDYLKAIEHYTNALEYAKKVNDNELLGDVYNNLGQSHTQLKDYSQAQKHLQTALTYRKKQPDRDDEGTTLNNLGTVFWRMHDYQKAASHYLAASKHLESTPNIKLTAITFNNLGNAYVKIGNVAGALDAYIKSLNLKEQFGTPDEIATANMGIGNLFYTSNQYEKAVTHYNAALKIAVEQSDSTEVALIERNLGAVYNALNNFDRALKYHQSSLAYFKKNSMSSDVAKTFNNIGNLYQAQKMYAQALDYYQQSLAIKTNLKDIEGRAITYKNMGQIQLLMEDYPPALHHTLNSIELCKQLNDKMLLMGNYLQLSKIYAAKGDFRNAYLSLETFRALDAEIYEKEGQNALAEMIARFGVHEKDKEISGLKTTQQTQKEKLALATRDKWLLILLSVFIMGVAIVIYVFYNLKQREIKKRIAIQLELEDLNHNLEERVQQEVARYTQQQQILIQKSKLESLGVMAAGMAHEINQPLSAITMGLSNLRIKAQKSELTESYITDKIHKLTDDIQRIRSVIEHVRQFSRDQVNSSVEKIDVQQTIKDAAALIAYDLAKQQIKLKLQLNADTLTTVGSKFKLEQVFLNLISNARDAIREKAQTEGYANEEQLIEITATRNEEYADIHFYDNGTGVSETAITKMFDPFYTTKSPEKGTGLGLSICYGIITEMGGKIKVSSVQGEYTRFTVTLPILEEQQCQH